MTDTTDIKKQISNANYRGDHYICAKVADIEAIIDQLEAERQRVAEITEQYVDRTTALSFASQRVEKAEKSNAFLKEELAQQANFNPDWDMLEACRESWREVVALLKEREAELAALKGEQVPVGWIKSSPNEAVSWDSVDPIYLAGSNAPVGWRSDYKPVYNRPQNPVVLPAEFYSAVQNNDGMFELSENCMCAISSAIEAAGGIVKDGE